MRSFFAAVDEAVSWGLGHPRAAAVFAVMGLVGTFVGVLVSPAAAAIFVAALFSALVAIFVFALRQRAGFDGPYTVLESDVLWDLKDPDATEACCTKRLNVRFNYPTIALQERAWGNGDPLSAFTCDYGEPAKYGADGPAKYVVIALPATRQRGEEATLTSHRTSSGSFGGAEEWIELDHSQASRRSIFEVRFPVAKPPHDLRLYTASNGRERPIPDSELLSEGDRKVYRLEELRLGRGELYRLKWSW